MKFIVALAATVSLLQSASAHEGHSHPPSLEKQREIIHLNTEPPKYRFVVQHDSNDVNRPELADLFAPFSDRVKVRFDNDFLYVESDGMPNHPMMIGITAWQQQVPIPQSYQGDNAWRIPLHPVPAKQPMSAKSNFFRGAIALAVNGVPIFNPIKNDGKTDTLLAGELDQWGGHCGRADDYHYHIAPVHLEKIVGAGNPVAVALDGYPIYGFSDPDGTRPADLDGMNGHTDSKGHYHYHATRSYPYLNGGFYGEVVERDGQVHPQPSARGVRPALSGLKGAKITGFEHPDPDRYVVRYQVFGDERSVEYTLANDGSAEFRFISERGETREFYLKREGGRQQRSGEQRSGEQRGVRDPLLQVLDIDGDNQIDRAELRKASALLRARDLNRDGKVAFDELLGPINARDVRKVDSAAVNRNLDGRQPDTTPRQPWILVHAEEVDLDGDGTISREEIIDEAERAFKGYDRDRDGQLSGLELSGRGVSKSAMGGFLKGHSKELDRDGDGVVTRPEAIGNAERMFEKMDRDNDGIITAAEMEASRR